MITKNIFNRYLALAMTFLFTSAAAWAAPTPVAVWSHDFISNAVKTDDAGLTYTLDARGNTITEDGITISQSGGNSLGALITVSNPASFGSSAVVLIKYSGFVAAANQRRALMGFETNDGNRGGLRMNAAGDGKINGCIEGAGDYNGCTTGSAIGESGYLLMSAKMGSGGTSVYYGATLASLSGGHGSSLQWSGRTISKFSIGGAINSATNPSADGLVIEGIAIFKGIHYTGGTTTDFADFVFPEPQTKFLKFYYPLDGDATNLGTASDEGLRSADGEPVFVDGAPFGLKSFRSGNTNAGAHTGSIVLEDSENGLVPEGNGWTFSFWFNSNGIGSWRDVCGFNIGSVNFKFEKNASNELQMYNGVGLPDLSGNTIPFTPNEWMNITVVSKDEEHFTIYAKGAKILDYPLDTYTGTTKIYGEGLQTLTKLIIGAKGNNSDGSRASTALSSNYAIYDYAVNTEQIAYLASAEPIDFYAGALTSLSTTIAADTKWSELVWTDDKGKAHDWQDGLIAKIDVTDNATLTLDTEGTIPAKSVIISGTGDLDIINPEKLPSGVNTSAATGKVAMVIDATTADITPTTAELETMRGSGYTYKLRGSDTTGVHLDYFIDGQNSPVTQSIVSHFIFESGVHTMSYRRNAGNLFASGHSDDNPTVLVMNGATLNFTAHDLSGWSGGANITGVIRVNDGGKLNFLEHSNGTFFYRQRLFLEPGAYVSHNFGPASGEGRFRWQGGTAEATAQIYVPDSTSDLTAKPAVIEQKGASALVLASDNTRGLAIYVGTNSKLQIKSDVKIYHTNDTPAQLHRYGEGILEFTKAVDINTLTAHAGSLVFAPTENATFRISNALSGNLKIAAKGSAVASVDLPQSYTGKISVESGTFMLPSTTHQGALSISDENTSIAFSQSVEPGEEVVACTGVLTYGETTSGTVNIPVGNVYVGTVIKRARITINLDEKKFSYTLANVISNYEFTASDLEQVAAADVDNGGVCHVTWDVPKNFAADCVFTGVDTDQYLVWVENGINLYVAKKTNSLSIKFNPASATEGTISTVDPAVGGFPVAGKFWNHSKIYTGTGAGTTELMTVKDGNGNELADTRVYYYMPNMYDVNKRGTAIRNYQTTGNGKLTYSYFDDTIRLTPSSWPHTVITEGEGDDQVAYTIPMTPKQLESDPANLGWCVAIKGMPYQMFDLYIYHASDQTAETITLLPIAVKADDGEWQFFAGDNHGSTIKTTINATWNGAAYCDEPTMVEGKNYIRYRISKATLGIAADQTIDTIYLSHPSRSTWEGRLGLAGIQLVEVSDDGLYTRQPDPEDMGGDDDERNVWLREGAWLNSAGEAMDYPESGERNVTINGDEVKAITVDGVISATSVSLKNTAPAEGEERKSFKFLTKESLSTVADPNENPEYILNAPVDAINFSGDLYLQARISGQISLGDNARVVFVAYDDDVTTAYPYIFTGANNAIEKIGTGTFIVPSSMYNRPFTFDEGKIQYSVEGNVSGVISGSGEIVIDPGEGKVVTLSGNNTGFTGTITVKSGILKIGHSNALGVKNNSNRTILIKTGAALDMGGTGNSIEGKTYTIKLEENSKFFSSVAAGADSKWSFLITEIELLGDAEIYAEENRVGMSRGYNNQTAINLNGHTLTKTGSGEAFFSNLHLNGTGTFDISEGSVRIERGYSDGHPVVSADSTLKVASGASLILGNYNGGTALTVNGTLVLNGTTTLEGDSSNIIVTGTLSVPDVTVINKMTINGAAITGTGTIKVPQTGSLTISTEVTSTAALMLAKGGSFTAAQSVKFASFVLGEDYSAAEIDGIANLSFNTIELTDGATLDMSAKIRYPYYTFGAAQNGKIKITTPTSRKRIANVAGGDASGITLVDENGEELDSCVYGGYLYYGTLCTDTEVVADEIAANVVYPSTTTVTGYDPETEFLVSDGKGGVAVVTKTDSVSINFGAVDETSGMVDTADTNVGAYPVSGASWNNSLDSIKDGKGETSSLTVSIDEANFLGAANMTVTGNEQQNGNQKLTYGYLDNAEGKVWGVTLTNIPYSKFDLYLIAANNGEVGENGKIEFLPYQITIDGKTAKYYNSSTEGTVNSVWNAKPYCEGAMVEGENFIKIKFNHKPTTLSIGHPSLNEGVCSLAAIQIVEDKSESNGIYIRRSDADLVKDGIEKTWTAANSWLDSDGNPTTWSAEGQHFVTIDASTVSEITVNDKIAADSVTVTGTAGENGFQFLTLEPLDEVADVKEDAPFRLDAPVSLIDFHGDVYLQSRITDQIQLGEYAHIVFVAMEEGEETTAYQYDFNGTIQPIKKIGPGTFIVPESMYENVPFNIDAGYIKYDYSGESVVTVKKQISGKGGLIKSGSGSVKFNVYNSFKGGTTIDEGTILLGDNDWALGDTGAQIRVNEGAALDVNGRNKFGYNLTLNGGSLKNTGSDANTNQVQFKSITLEADSVIDLAHTTAIINNNYTAATLNLDGYTLTKRGSADFFVCNVTVNAGTIKLEEGAIKVHNNACDFTAVDLIVAGSVQFNGNDAPTVFKTLTFEAGGALTQPNGKMLTVSDTLSGSGSIQNLTLANNATVELGDAPITVTGTLAFGETLKIKGGAFDKEAFAFTNEPTTKPNIILVNEEGEESSDYYFNVVNGKYVIASNKAMEISGVVTVSTDIPSWTTTRMKLTGNTVFVIDTVEGMPSAIDFLADEAHNLAFVYAAPYTGELTFDDNITVEKKYAPEAWSLVPTTIGPGPIITIIGGDTEEKDFTTALTVQEGGVLHLERLIKLSAENNVNEGGTLEIVADTTPDAPETFAKVHLADRGMKGTLNVAKGTTYYPFGFPDQLWYGGTTSVVNVYGTLDMSDSSNARWTLRQGITINFYVGAKAVGDGQEGGHHSAFQFNSANCVLNFLKDGENGGEIDFNLRLRPQNVFTMNIEEGVIVNMGGKLDTVNGEKQPFVVTGEGKVVINGTYEFSAPPEVAPEQLEIAEGGSLTIKPWMNYDFTDSVTSNGESDNPLSFEGNGFTTATGYKELNEGNKAIYTGVTPYRDLDINNVAEWTTTIYGTFPRLENGSFVSLGNNAHGIALINGKEENVVKVVELVGASTMYKTLIEVAIPEAHTKEHLYAIIRKAAGVELYVDGIFRGSYNSAVTMNRGIQIGGVYGGVSGCGVLKFAQEMFGNNANNATLRASYVDNLRVYKNVLGPKANMLLAKEMPYETPGLYMRELIGNETYAWEQEGEWKKDEEIVSKPVDFAEVEISVPDANVSAGIKLTEKTLVGSLKISGEGMLGIVAENAGKLVNYGDTTIDGVYVTVKYTAMDITNGALKIVNNGGINFDFSDYNVNHITERTAIPVTGISEKLDKGAVELTPPGQTPSRKMTLEYNETTKRYEVVVTIDREPGEVIWNDEGDIAYGKEVLTTDEEPKTSVLFPGDTIRVESDLAAANGVPGLNFHIVDGGTLKLTGGQNAGSIQVDEGGAYDVNGGAVIPTTLKLNGGKLTNSAATDVQPLVTTLEMMANSIVDGNVAFGALTLNGTGTLTINEGASIKLGGAVTKSTGSELNVVNNGVITLTSGIVPQFNTLTGTGYIEFAQLNAPDEVQLVALNSFTMPIHLKGISGSAYLGSVNLAVNNNLVIDGSVAFNQGSSNKAYTLNKVSGTGAFTLSAWSTCSGLGYTISELNNFTGSLNIVNNATVNCTFNFAIGNIVTDRIVYSTPLVKLTCTITREGNTIPFDISTVQLNGEETTLLMLEKDGIYHASATYNGTNYRDVNAAIEAAGAEHITDIVVYDPNPTLTGDYIVKEVDGVLKVVTVEKTEITSDTRVSDWTGYTNERLVIDGTESEVTVTFDATISEAIKEVRLVGNVKLIAEGAQVIETSKLKGMEGAKLTILSDIEGDFEVKSAIKLNNVTLSHAVMTDAEIEITGEVTLAGIRASSIYAHDATLKTVDGKTHKFPESRTMKIAGTVAIDSTLEIAAGATLTINAETAATLKILKSKIGDGAVSLTENVTLYIPAGVQVLNVNGAGKVDGAGLISVKDFASTPAPVESWSGTYVLAFTGTGLASVNPNNYGNANSIVRMNGVNGWFVTNEAYLSTIELIDNGTTPALTINNGSSGANLLFGKIIGGGTIATAGGSSQKSIVKDGSEFYGSITMTTTKSIVFGDTISGLNNNMIIVQNGYSAMIGAGKTWSAASGIFINGTIKGSGTLASATTFGATSIIDVSEGNLTLGAGVTLPETMNIKGAKSGSVVLAGVPAGTQVPKFNLIDASGSFELKLQSNGQLVLVGQEVTISIPEVDNTSYSVIANGKPLVVPNGSITVDSGTTITVTYTPIEGYVGGGSITTTIVNELTPIRSDLISVKKGARVIIREYKGARVTRVEGLEEDGIATGDSIKINGSVYSLTTPSEGEVEIKDDGIVIIHIKPNN